MPPSSSQPRSPPQAATPSSIADNRLGLSAQDVATLRQHQQLAHAQTRSPAGSQASSQGRLLLDPGSLQLLSRHFDRVMQAISQRLEQVDARRFHRKWPRADPQSSSTKQLRLPRKRSTIDQGMPCRWRTTRLLDSELYCRTLMSSSWSSTKSRGYAR
jgi:hypothetical protein